MTYHQQLGIYVEGRQSVQTPLDMVREFREASGKERTADAATLNLRANLIWEESEEAETELHLLAIKKGSKRATAKELADLVYVAYGAADCLGIDLDRVIAAVHESNMSKFPATTREDGKVLKGPNYREPDLSFVEG